MKLSARGRNILARVSKVQPKVNGSGSYRTELVLLSDGVIGVKTTWLHEDGHYEHDTGWKIKARLKPKLRNPVTQETIDSWVNGYTERGWTCDKLILV